MTEARKAAECLIAVCPFDWGAARGMLEGVAAYKELPLHVRENILRFLARTSDPPPRIDSARIERLEAALRKLCYRYPEQPALTREEYAMIRAALAGQADV